MKRNSQQRGNEAMRENEGRKKIDTEAKQKENSSLTNSAASNS